MQRAFRRGCRRGPLCCPERSRVSRRRGVVRNMLKMRLRIWLALSAFAAQAVAQQAVPRRVPASVEWLADAPPDAAALAASPEAFAPLLERNGLALDVAGRTLAIRGSTLHDADSLAGQPVEFLVVT